MRIVIFLAVLVALVGESKASLTSELVDGWIGKAARAAFGSAEGKAAKEFQKNIAAMAALARTEAKVRELESALKKAKVGGQARAKLLLVQKLFRISNGNEITPAHLSEFISKNIVSLGDDGKKALKGFDPVQLVAGGKSIGDVADVALFVETAVSGPIKKRELAAKILTMSTKGDWGNAGEIPLRRNGYWRMVLEEDQAFVEELGSMLKFANDSGNPKKYLLGEADVLMKKSDKRLRARGEYLKKLADQAC